MFLPEFHRQFTGAGEQQINVFQYLVVEIVFRMNAEYRGLDAQIDILGDQRDGYIRVFSLQRQCRAQDIVIRGVARQGIGQ